MPRYNIPFYFAIARRGAKPGDLRQARSHIATTFGIKGRCEFVRTDPTFYLFRVVS